MTIRVSNCSNGELVLHAPQCELDKFVAQIEAAGGKVERPAKRPAPIPQTIYNWDNADNNEKSVAAFAQAVARSTNGKPTPIPQRHMDWSDRTNESVLVNN